MTKQGQPIDDLGDLAEQIKLIDLTEFDLNTITDRYRQERKTNAVLFAMADKINECVAAIARTEAKS